MPSGPLVLHVAGARPNFMKVAPVMAALGRHPHVRQRLVHTGQHYDRGMSEVFFDDLGLPRPDVDLGVGSGTHAEQTAAVMVAFERVCQKERPDLVVVVGDVNSTVACSLVAAKLGIPIAHVEAGLRSFDRSMPEEINRVVTDRLADLLFTTEASANLNLENEGVEPGKIRFVGNVMVDTLLLHVAQARERDSAKALGVAKGGYGLVTLHRPGNVDDPDILSGILRELSGIASTLPLLFPVHPRTSQRMEEVGWQSGADGLRILEPLGYLDFLGLLADARCVITDSGGIQEETTALGVPCLTLRPSTERPITLEMGTNRLVRPQDLRGAIEHVLTADRLGGPPSIPLWDGAAGNRIATEIVDFLEGGGALPS